MRYRLAEHLPLEVPVGAAVYVLELVATDGGGGGCLRARDRDDPVVFLLADFPSLRAARMGLETGFDVIARPMPLRILDALCAQGLAERLLPESMQRRVANTTPAAPSRSRRWEADVEHALEGGWQFA